MELETLNRKPAADNEINWVTATFMALFHIGAIAALFGIDSAINPSSTSR